MDKQGINKEMSQAYLQEYFENDESLDSPKQKKRNNKLYQSQLHDNANNKNYGFGRNQSLSRISLLYKSVD